jgi:two-component system response regulator
MSDKGKIAPILMAEDDEDDRMMTEKAFRENRIGNPLVTVANGADLLDYLRHLGKFTDGARSSKPCLILLDLNMPKIDGREALKIIKGDENLMRIPVVIITTSKAEEDILVSYNVGANSYITKPITFDGLVKVIKTLKDYWLEIVELPSIGESRSHER